MQNLRNPKWLFLVNTLPILLLFALLTSQYSIIKTLLDDAAITLWLYFGLWLAVLGLTNFAYTVYVILKQKAVSVWYGFLALFTYIPFMYVYAYYLNDILPVGIPRWMISNNVFLYVGTFLMPTLVYALFVLVTYFTPENSKQKAWQSFLLALSVPLAGYIFLQVILPLWQPFESAFGIHVLLVLFIAATVLFLFFLLRSMVIVTLKKSAFWQKYALFWKIPIAIVLPLIGLAVNNGQLLSEFKSSSSGVFGDFQSPWFYILAVLNGLLLCLPNSSNKNYRLFLFVGRSAMLAFTLYFFLVFLPFLPLSVLAIIAVGAGVFMLAPLLLFVIHVHTLSTDFAFLTAHFSKKKLFGGSLLSFWLLPALLTASFIHDKYVLHQALAYVYSPNYAKEYAIDTRSLAHTLSVLKRHRNGRGRSASFTGDGTLYITSYFTWLVLDNLTLPGTKLNTLEQLFFNEETDPLGSQSRPENETNEVKITGVTTQSTYHEINKTWETWVNLELTNTSNQDRFATYATTFTLPDGCWISDYYLYIGDRKEPGILAEKKSAMWVFAQIRNENRDPGILHYLTGNEIAFQVFPFARNEVRKTGIAFLHKEPVTLHLDTHSVVLGSHAPPTEGIETAHAAYVTAQQKSCLPVVKRTPYFHFLVDVSQHQKEAMAGNIARIENLLAEHKPLAQQAKISFVNTYVSTAYTTQNWKEAYARQPFEGGFFLDRALRKNLTEAYRESAMSYPVFVVVTDTMAHAILEHDLADLSFTFPEGDTFFRLDQSGNLKAHSLTTQPKQERQDAKSACMFCETVVAYTQSNGTVTYLPQNDAPSVVVKTEPVSMSITDIKQHDWYTALHLQAVWQAQLLQPELAEKEWLNTVKYSFKAHVMMPVTSFLVVENEAQKAMLKKKQEQVLAGNKDLDVGDDVQRMSEPGLIGVGLLVLLALWYRDRRRRTKAGVALSDKRLN